MSPRTLVVAALFAAPLACAPRAEPRRPPPVPAAPALASAPAPPPARPVPAGHLRREDVLAVLSDGPPAFLQHVEVEPVRGAGGFQGWRVLALREPSWREGPLKPGDVVVRVNDRAVETPFQFFDVFQALAIAPSLSLTVLRGGQRQVLRLPIDDDPASPTPHLVSSAR